LDNRDSQFKNSELYNLTKKYVIVKSKKIKENNKNVLPTKEMNMWQICNVELNIN